MIRSARPSPSLSSSLDTELFRKTLKTECLVNEKGFLAENWHFVSGKHTGRGGGTNFPATERFS
ncbi:hypothetical protein K0M31_008695 [Melipona bicolor]|uniref:Uncharacterized protein n=1 Tax=Melipona bicolor TaxID=60889 RepID=A0AA40FQC4_9HYME|nr:hypothetical protein K0M31_008695 [Melipona bicolor]